MHMCGTADIDWHFVIEAHTLVWRGSGEMNGLCCATSAHILQTKFIFKPDHSEKV